MGTIDQGGRMRSVHKFFTFFIFLCKLQSPAMVGCEHFGPQCDTVTRYVLILSLTVSSAPILLKVFTILHNRNKIGEFVPVSELLHPNATHCSFY